MARPRIKPRIKAPVTPKRLRLGERLGWGAHAAVLAALVVNLWFGGDLVEARFGHAVRSAAELLLIGAWLILVVGMRFPLPWQRDRDDEGDAGDDQQQRP